VSCQIEQLHPHPTKLPCQHLKTLPHHHRMMLPHHPQCPRIPPSNPTTSPSPILPCHHLMLPPLNNNPPNQMGGKWGNGRGFGWEQRAPEKSSRRAGRRGVSRGQCASHTLSVPLKVLSSCLGGGSLSGGAIRGGMVCNPHAILFNSFTPPSMGGVCPAASSEMGAACNSHSV